MKKSINGLVVWFVATLYVIYSFSLNTASVVFSEEIKTALHASNIGISFAFGTFVLGFAFMQIPAGFLLDKFNPRWVVSSGILLLVLGNVAISYSNTISFFAASNFLQGTGASFAFAAAAILIAEWFPIHLFPILFGFTQTLSCIFAGIIHYYFTIALFHYSWNSIYLSLSILGLVLLMLAMTFIRRPTKAKIPAKLSIKQSLTSVLKNKQILLCSMAAATSFGILLAYASFWYIKIQEFYSVPKLQSIIISGIIFLGMGVGTPFLGWVSNIFKSRIMVVHVSLVLGTMALLLGIFLPHFNVTTLIITKIISFLIGFLLSGSMLFYTIISEISLNNTRGVAISVLNTAVFLLNTVMLFLPNLFLTTTSTDFFTYLWILPFFIMISILLLFFINDSFKKDIA